MYVWIYLTSQCNIGWRTIMTSSEFASCCRDLCCCHLVLSHHNHVTATTATAGTCTAPPTSIQTTALGTGKTLSIYIAYNRRCSRGRPPIRFILHLKCPTYQTRLLGSSARHCSPQRRFLNGTTVRHRLRDHRERI